MSTDCVQLTANVHVIVHYNVNRILMQYMCHMQLRIVWFLALYKSN